MFINQKKFGEIRESAKNGNEKAKMVLQAMRKFSSQEDVDRLVEDYYKVPEQTTMENVDIQEQVPNTQVEPQIDNAQMEEIKTEKVGDIDPQVKDPSQDIPAELNPDITTDVQNQGEVLDLTEILDNETDGLFDEIEIKDYSFNDFLKDKKRDGLRAKKNADYFKAYDMQGRDNYMQNKINAYKSKFDGRLRDNDRKFNDLGIAVDSYIKGTNEMLDDGVELNVDSANQAYGDFIDNDKFMSAFGRHWDEEDNKAIMGEIGNLMTKYGKANILAALNNFKSDTDGYKKYLDNQVDTEIGRYSKSVENLLK